MTEAADMDCRRTCRWTGAAAGLCVGLMLLILARLPLWLAMSVGAAIAVGLGFFLGWAFCTGPREVPVKMNGSATPVVDAPTAEMSGFGPPVAGPPKTRPDPLPVSPATVAGRVPLRPARKARAAALPPRGAAGARPVRAAGLDMAVSRTRTQVKTPASETLAAPRNGRPDNLQRIAGIGPVLERLLNDAGVWHFDQIASWKARDIAYFNGKIPGFRGRITRDGWVAQARALVAATPRDDAGQG